MIGQLKLKEQFNSLPKVFMLVGEEGCGKHTFVRELAKKFNLPVADLKLDENLEENIIEIQQRPTRGLYEIDLKEFDFDAQNKILKFVEEPAKNVNVVLLAESDREVLETVRNRCLSYEFAKYSIQELKDITKTDYEDYVYDILKTPGRVKKVNIKSIEECKILCDLLLEKIKLASYANTISIIYRLNFTDEYDKIDPALFLGMLKRESYLKGNLGFFDLLKDSAHKKIDVVYVLSKLWEASR